MIAVNNSEINIPVIEKRVTNKTISIDSLYRKDVGGPNTFLLGLIGQLARTSFQSCQDE